MERACQTLRDTISAEMATVYEVDHEGRGFSPRAFTGFPGSGPPKPTKTLGSMIGYAIAAQTPLVIEDLRREKRIPSQRAFLSLGVLSGVVVPIQDRGTTYGVSAFSAGRRSILMSRKLAPLLRLPAF